jgi:hypothetical protein
MDNNIISSTSYEVEIPQMKSLQNNFSAAFKLVDDVVLKNYITKLPDLPVVPLDDSRLTNSLGKIRLFKITEMVYEQDESATYKFASVFNAVAATNSAIVTVINSDGAKTDFYLGIRSLSDNNSTQTSYSALVNAMKGQFPGTKTENLKVGQIEQLLNSIEKNSISAVSCVANNKNKDFVDNNEYLQGLEKLALAMQGSKYTAVIIANSTSQEQLSVVRQGYENIYTQLSPYANTVVAYGTNTTQTSSDTETSGTNETKSSGTVVTSSETKSETKNIGSVETISKSTIGSKIGSTIGTSLTAAGAAIGSIIPGAGTLVGGAVGGLIGAVVSIATNKNVSRTHGGGSESVSNSSSNSTSNTTSYGTSYNLSHSDGLAIGENQNLQLNVQNKPLIGMLDRIDKQLERLSEFESVGMWECAAYFLSEDSSVSKVAAATYKALMSGENSGLEVSAINTWNEPQTALADVSTKNMLIAKYVRNFIHPVFSYSINGYDIPVTPTSLVSGNELAIHMGLPRNSVCGFPVIKHADFGKEIVKYNREDTDDTVHIGKIFNMGREIDSSTVSLDVDSLAMHTFISGATGSGKSNTIYTLLNKLTAAHNESFSFMVIEPAKGEYKRVFGHKRNVSVFGTNPAYTRILRINPFKFPKEIHVLEHIDRLIEIFNVCWPMYAAMPAVLKDALLSSYSSCGWDLTTSTNAISETLFPNFRDLLEQLVKVINNSAYSEEVKSNYAGSLTTRVNSLTNGLNGQIFSANEIDNETLFDTNVIVDLSRIGSQETKSLIMGVLVMRLSEYRMSAGEKSNSKLKHITVLEEAHNILGTSNSSSVEGSNIFGKSVEMLSNAIAEMRTYGEGFIIADQSPSSVDISAIKNTNTKIIMRLPEENDRHMLGKSAALNDNQIDEIARLPQGVAVVYQNDWVEPVLCKIDRFNGEEKEFSEPSQEETALQSRQAADILINLVAQKRLDSPEKINCNQVIASIEKCDCSVKTKVKLYSLAKEYRERGSLRIWDDKHFSEQAHLIANILGLSDAVKDARELSFDTFGFTCSLNTIIARKITDVSDDMLLTISHYLVKAYSEDDADGAVFYRNWVEGIAERGKII